MRKNQYGNFTLKDVEKTVMIIQIEITSNYLFQSNIEGEIVNKIQSSRNNQNGLIINAGGYSYIGSYSWCAENIKGPIIELHISNIYNREDFRHKSLISKVAKGVICGFGAEGYIMSLKAMTNFLEKWKLIKN